MKKSRSWLPAALLLYVQFLGGVRGLSQLAFFVIYLEERLHLTPVTISGVIAGAQIAGMLMALLGGGISGRLGVRWALVAGLVLAGAGSLAFQATSPWVAALLWFVGGAGASLATVGSASSLTRISAHGSMGMLAAFYALSVTAGGAIGNPLAGVLIERLGFHALSWAGLVLAALTALPVAVWMAELEDQPSQTTVPRSIGQVMRDTARCPQVRLLIGLRSLPTIFYGALTVLIPLLLNNLTGSKVLVAAYGTTVLVAASAAQLITGRAADRFGALRPGLAAYAVLILAGGGLWLSAETVTGVYAFGVLGNAAAWALATLMYVWVSDGVPKPTHPPTFGLLHAVWSLSMIAGSVLGGWFATTQPGIPFLIAGLLNCGALFLLIVYYRGQSLPTGSAPRY